MANLREAIEGCLSIDINAVELQPTDRLLDLAI